MFSERELQKHHLVHFHIPTEFILHLVKQLKGLMSFLFVFSFLNSIQLRFYSPPAFHVSTSLHIKYV